MLAGFKSLLWSILSVTAFNWSNGSLDQINNKFNQVFPIVGNPCCADIEKLARQWFFCFQFFPLVAICQY